jgi:hypothetical protein
VTAGLDTNCSWVLDQGDFSSDAHSDSEWRALHRYRFRKLVRTFDHIISTKSSGTTRWSRKLNEKIIARVVELKSLLLDLKVI